MIEDCCKNSSKFHCFTWSFRCFYLSQRKSKCNEIESKQHPINLQTCLVTTAMLQFYNSWNSRLFRTSSWVPGIVCLLLADGVFEKILGNSWKLGFGLNKIPEEFLVLVLIKKIPGKSEVLGPRNSQESWFYRKTRICASTNPGNPRKVSGNSQDCFKSRKHFRTGSIQSLMSISDGVEVKFKLRHVITISG